MFCQYDWAIESTCGRIVSRMPLRIESCWLAMSIETPPSVAAPAVELATETEPQVAEPVPFPAASE